MKAILASLAIFLLLAPAAPRLAHASADSAAEDRACELSGKCGILLGSSRGDLEPLSQLVHEIVTILDAPEVAWVKARRDRPPTDLTAKLARFLRHCYEKVIQLEQSLIEPSVAKLQAPRPPIVENPIPWGPDREQLMSEYLREHTDDPSTDLTAPTTIVTHWTDTPTFRSTYETFAPLETDRENLRPAGKVNVGCHFVVERDGTIHQLQPETKIARHAVGMNRNALCIENVGGPKAPLTPAQLKSNEALIKYLVGKYPTIDNMIGHAEYRSFEGTYIFTEKKAYRSDRADEPGKAFLAQLRHDLSPQLSCANPGN